MVLEVIIYFMSEEIKLKILYAWLEDIPFDDVRWESLLHSAEQIGYDKALVRNLFPQRIPQALSDLSHSFDQTMLKKLESIDIKPLAIRERVKTATMTRLTLMSAHKEASRKIMGYWANPLRGLQAKKNIWRSADTIWTWVGDTSTDYNYYTKRTLLSAVLGTTYLFWIQDTDKTLDKTESFLIRRIENVLQFGKLMHSTKNKINVFTKNCI